MDASASPGSSSRRSRTTLVWVLALALLFLFRLGYGLSQEFFFEDETQIFLMGLRYYATGAWPYFGPDVVWTKSEIPGALQALLVGWPLRVWAAPEAPFILLNALSFAALCAMAWYICARLPRLPRWLVWGWVMTAPWTLEYGTHIINPSYVLAPAVLFFIGFFEAVPRFSLGRIRRPVAFAMMGAATTSVLQLHMSWPLLLPYAGIAWLLGGWNVAALALDAGGYVGGLLAGGLTLLPTLLAYGPTGGSGGTLRNLHPHIETPALVLSIVARLFSFPSLEIWRFMTTDDGKREMFLLRHLWIAPIAVVVWVAGIVQPFWMLREWLRRQSPFPEWTALRWLVAGTVVTVYASYCFVMEPSQAHAFWVTGPVAFVFAAYCWTSIDSPRWRTIAGTLLVLNIAFHIGQAAIHLPAISLYRDRHVVATAIAKKEPEMFAHRRAFAVDGGPALLDDKVRPWDSVKEVRLDNPHLELGPRRVALWTVTLRNTSQTVAYRDVLYQALYQDAAGNVVIERHDFVKQIFQPGESVTLEINDGFVDKPYASATIHVLAAEGLIPLAN